ncbi:MAG: SDR family NAD(P)-dependent oxidoreductase [Bacteroidetes Order II. Incertae sedis bacterium]|nr:SDR family NAD(P)-dependent oxidoreductase [Bacteroidetes Order II. bacterium]
MAFIDRMLKHGKTTMRNNLTFFILGGYGGAGFPIARLLLQETPHQVVIAGRSLKRAQEAANQLNNTFSGERALAKRADATDEASLREAVQSANVMVSCTSATEHALTVARVALENGMDYLDVHYPHSVWKDLQTLELKILEKKRLFITQAGFHPGLPAAFIRALAPDFDECDRATVGMLMKIRDVGTVSSAGELVDGIGDYRAWVYRNGGWKKATWQDRVKIDFGPEYGVQTCMPLWFEEMRSLPEAFGLKETGTYVAGFNGFVDNVLSPLIMGLYKIRKGLGRKLLSKLLIWGSNTFTSPPLGVWFTTEISGRRNGQPHSNRILAFHPDAYEMTAIPAVACLLQYASGVLHQTGLHLMGHAVNPQTLLQDMTRMGVKITN